jgi:RNA polymerase sigma factor (sigma-70 family)
VITSGKRNGIGGEPAASSVTGGGLATPSPLSGTVPRPYGQSVRAREMVSAIVAGDVTGLGSAYDKYAPDLYAYCQSRLADAADAADPADPADAASLVQDVFIIASARVSQLRQPDRLRAWLFAVARNECHRRLRASARSAPLYEAASEMTGEMPMATAGPAADPRALVAAALTGLSPTEREVCELSLRHDLYGADLGDVLGLPREQAQALAARARSRFGASLGVLLAAGPGPDFCPELAALLHGRGATPTGLWRVRARRHIERCEVCRDRMRRDLSPAVMLGLLPKPELPAGLRHQILRAAADVSPDAAAGREEVTSRADPFGAGGFPVQLTAPSATRWQLAHGLAAVAAIVALGVLGGGMFYVDYASAHPGPPSAAAAPGGGSGWRAFALAGPASVPSVGPSSGPSGPGAPGPSSSAPVFIPSANGSTVPSPLRAPATTTPSGRSNSSSGSTSPSHSGTPTHVSPSPTHASPVPTHSSPSSTPPSSTPPSSTPPSSTPPSSSPPSSTPTSPPPAPTTPPPATTLLPSTPSPATSASIGLLGLKLSL